MKAVEARAHGGVIGQLHDAVSAAPVVDVLAPGQGLVGELDVVFGGQLTGLAQLIRNGLIVIQGGRSHIGAHEQHGRAQASHQVELRAQPAQRIRERLRGDLHAVAERLVHVQGETELGGHLTQLLG